MTKIRTSRHNRTHQTLHEMALADTRAANPFDPREIRLSAAGACPRQQTLRILGAPATPESVTQLSIFHAGHYWEDYLASLWEAQYPSQVNRQVTVDTPYGTGHIDLWIEPIHHLVECKTTKVARRAQLPLAEHLDQVNLYLHFWGNAHGATGEIAYLLKETGEILTFPVVYDPHRIPRLVERLDQILIAVQIDQPPLPIPEEAAPFQFPCGWMDTYGQFTQCPFWAHSWGEPTMAEDADDTFIVDAPETWIDALQTYATAVTAIKDTKQALKPYEQIKKDTEAALKDWFDAYSIAGLRTPEGILRRTVSKASTTWDVPKALADGAMTAEQIAPYETGGVGTQSDVWLRSLGGKNRRGRHDGGKADTYLPAVCPVSCGYGELSAGSRQRGDE